MYEYDKVKPACYFSSNISTGQELVLAMLPMVPVTHLLFYMVLSNALCDAQQPLSSHPLSLYYSCSFLVKVLQVSRAIHQLHIRRISPVSMVNINFG